jgi:hypothetical protein
MAFFLFEGSGNWEVQYNIGNLIHMGPRYRRITENDGLLKKVETNLLIII